MSEKSAKRERAAAAMAARQHGVVSIGQLWRAGFDYDDVGYRVRIGRLHRIHRGVYAVGHRGLSREGRWMAAVLACGSTRSGGEEILDRWGAALSYRSAAALWGLLSPTRGAVDVTVPGWGGRKRRSGVRLHRSVSLMPGEVTLRGGIPVTTPARTIADLRRLASSTGGNGHRRLVSPAELRRAIRQADMLGLPIGPDEHADRTRSELERRFLRLCRRHGLPAPEVNVRIGSHEVDFLWRDRGLVVETDGYRFHRGRAAFEDDRARDLALRAGGFEVVRLSHRQVVDDRDRLATLLRSILLGG